MDAPDRLLDEIVLTSFAFRIPVSIFSSLDPFLEQKDGSPISPWHDIPLKADGSTFNFITEIPKL